MNTSINICLYTVSYNYFDPLLSFPPGDISHPTSSEFWGGGLGGAAIPPPKGALDDFKESVNALGKQFEDFWGGVTTHCEGFEGGLGKGGGWGNRNVNANIYKEGRKRPKRKQNLGQKTHKENE